MDFVYNRKFNDVLGGNVPMLAQNHTEFNTSSQEPVVRRHICRQRYGLHYPTLLVKLF